MKTPTLLFALAVGLHFAPTIHAAPLDAFLTATRPAVQGEGQIELAYDVANDTVDILGIRKSNGDTTNLGDYHGGHLRAGIAVTPKLWLDGAVWLRDIDLRGSEAKVRSWQIAGQYKLVEGQGSRPAIALRLGAWGNRASRLGEAAAMQFLGARLDSVNMEEPRDRQLQLDAIATWQAFREWEVSAFGGIGTSHVDTGAISGTTTRGGCSYDLAFGPTEVIGTLAEPCSEGTVVERFSVPNSVYGVDVYREARYSSRFAHAGLSTEWSSGPWKLRVGYQFQILRRGRIDDIVRRRGGEPSTRNHILAGEVAYRIGRNVSLFLRGQYMQRQFTGEIPFAYNTFTARRFHKKYGIASAGVVFRF